jgi:hypothetical protein
MKGARERAFLAPGHLRARDFDEAKMIFVDALLPGRTLRVAGSDSGPVCRRDVVVMRTARNQALLPVAR